MISHKHQVIFIHIPKCAGSSIEKFFGISKISHKWDKANRLYLKGWDSVHKIHLQHAKASDLLDKRLIEKKVWDEYFKFAIVRNPWDRAYSDYLWMMKDRKVKGSFEDYVLADGPFKKHLLDGHNKHNRADHLTPQYKFIYDQKGELMVDFVGRFETLQTDFEKICERLEISDAKLPHEKKSKVKKLHYSEFMNATQKNLVADIYAEDIALFNYDY